MSCQHCGRHDGHYIGCRAIESGSEPPPLPPENSSDQCARPECTNPRAPQGKGPRPKYCEDHKTGSK